MVLLLFLLVGAVFWPARPAAADSCGGADGLHGIVFLDQNANGSQEAAEPGVADITVVALGPGRVELASCTTAADGQYGLDIPADAFPVRLEFRGIESPLRPGPRGLDSGAAMDVVAMPQRYGLGVIDGGSPCGAAPEGSCVPPVELGDRVWLDENGDDYQDPGEPGFMGLVINLYVGDGNGGYMLRDTTVTDNDGRYRFTNLEPATTYFVVVEDVSTGSGGGDLVGGPLGPSLGSDLFMVNSPMGGSELPWAGYPYLVYAVEHPGEVNHELDFAFAPEPSGGPTAVTWSGGGARSLLQSPFLAALLLLAVLLGCLWLVLRSALIARRG